LEPPPPGEALLSQPVVENPIAASAATIAKNLIFFILPSLLRVDTMTGPPGSKRDAQRADVGQDCFRFRGLCLFLQAQPTGKRDPEKPFLPPMQ